MVAARKESSCGSDEKEELYEKIEAPKWVDFTTPEKTQLANDYEWFCLRAGCNQNHDGALDPSTLSANFLRRVMEARSPNVRLGNDSRLLTPRAIAKCPISAPARATKSRIPRWNDISQKRLPERVVRKLISAPADTVASPQHVKSAKAVTTPSHKKCQNNSGAFRSARSSKVVISVKGHVKSAAKALVFHSPKGTVKPAKEKKVKPSRVHAESKKFEAGTEANGSIAVGHLCKSSRCAANDPNYNTPVSVPLKARFCVRKLKSEQQEKGVCLNRNKPDVSLNVGKQDRHQECHLYDEEIITDKKSLGTEKKMGMQRCSDERSSGSIDMEIDGNSRHGSLDVCSDIKCSVSNGREECGEKLSTAELVDGGSGVQNKGVAAIPPKRTSIKHDSGPSADAGASILAETEAPISAINVTSGSEIGLANGVHDFTSEVAECMAKREDDTLNKQEPVVTLSTQILTAAEGLVEDKEAEKFEETSGVMSVADTPKEKAHSKHQNEKRQGTTTILKRSNKKRNTVILVQIPNPDQDSEKKDITNLLSNMLLDDLDNDANKENTSTPSNSNISLIKKPERKVGKMIACEIPRKIKEIPEEKVRQGSISGTRMEHKTAKLTNPKPFRFRTDERGILREANHEKRHQQPEASLVPMKKQTDLPKQGKYRRQTEQCKDGNVRKMQTASNMKLQQVVKSRYLASAKPARQKMVMTTQQTQKLDAENLLPKRDIGEKVKDQPPEMDQKQEGSIREVKPRKKWSTSTLPEEESPCTNDRSCSHGKRHPTIPKAPNFHTIHIHKTCCAKKIAN
ncbi:unnamed protein product [Victoria cruziana]